MKVDFVIGGTQKGGTSALDAFLRQHPQICMPADMKEVHFFDREEMFRGSKPDYDKYHAHFRPGKQHAIIGEASPIYMYWNSAPYRIWSYNPDMKWIVILRNPVERAYSAWNMERKRGLEQLSFADAIAQEAVRCRYALPLQHRVYSYLDRGFYAGQLRRLLNIFGSDKCLVLLNEDLQTDQTATLKRIFRFLQVNDSFTAPATRVFEHEYDEPLDPKTYAQLMRAFHFDLRALEQLIGRDLSSWYDTDPAKQMQQR
jgi:hypothetical protein